VRSTSTSHALCLKAFLDLDETTARAAGSTTIREADFYALIAPRTTVRVPNCITAIVDRQRCQGLIVMRDLIADGARFCTAREAFAIDEAAASLEQIARLHAASRLLGDSPWIERRIDRLAGSGYISPAELQNLLDGPRGEGLAATVRDAGRLFRGLAALAERDAGRPHYLIHGDCHAGNIFRAPEGTGLIDWQLLQRGGWALDVAYHIAAVLPVALAEREERQLLGHYLETMRSLGCQVPDPEQAWAEYRESAVYGFYLWAITRRVEPDIITLFVNRLGNAVARHSSYALLGIS
jgi:aminoglycoside phosphotransferase (APT) family kinase protein